MVDKIDKDSDGKISEDELKAWLKMADRKYYDDETISHWAEIQRLLLNLHKDKKEKHDTKAPVSWEDYIRITRHEPGKDCVLCFLH